MAKKSFFAIVLFVGVLFAPFKGYAWTHYFSHNLGYGATESDVSFLQQYLMDQGYFHHSITDYFGPITFAGVRAWQAKNNIPSTGYFGPISRAFVNEVEMAATTTLATTTTSTAKTTSDPPATDSPSSSPAQIPLSYFVGGVTASIPNAPSVSPAVPIVSISITTTSTGIESNATTSFSANVLNSTNTAVTWSALYGTIDASGTYTAPSVLGTSTLVDTITATSQADNTKTATANIIVTSGLLGWWPLGEGTGTVAEDISGDASSGTWSGTPAGTSGYYSAGFTSSTFAGDFNGSDDKVQVSSNPPVAPNIKTIGFWAYLPSLSGTMEMVSKSSGGQGVEVIVNGGTIQFYVMGSSVNNATANNVFFTGAGWYYITATQNGPDLAMDIYVNGILEGTGTAPDSIGDTIDLTFGSWDGGGRNFDGELSDIQLYDRPVASSEVQTLYTQQTAPILIGIAPTSTTLLSGAATTFTASVADTTNTAVTWSALHGSINASGTYIAVTLASSTLLATDTVTAISVADNTKIATASVSVTNGIADWWKLNEGSGAIAQDSVNSAHNGAWHGTQSSASGTYYSSSIPTSTYPYSFVGSFNGSDDYIDPSLTMDYSTTSTFTWSVWVNLTSGINNDNVILGNRGFNPWIKLTPTAFEYGSGSLMNNTIPLGQWEFISVVKSGTSFYYYQNGALITSASSSVTGTDVPFYIGTDPNDTGDGYSKGSIGDVRIYNTPLTQSQIQTIYNDVRPVAISVSPTSTSLLANATTSFSATVLNATDTAVTWSALYGTINASGVYTAPSSTVSSTITDTITAISQADNTKVATATVTVSSGLLGWWPTNEGFGSTALDSSGNGNNGTWHGIQSGNSGYYTSYSTLIYTGTFDGDTNYISTSVNWPTSGSMTLWADPTTLNQWISPAGWKYAPSNGGYILIDEGDGSHWRAVFNSSGLGEADVQSTSSIPTNAWSQVMMTWNKIGSTTTITLYVNGVSRGSTTTAQVATSSIGSFYYGTAGQSANNDFTGFIDSVRVYDRALTPVEIQGIYNTEQSTNSSVPIFINDGA